MNRRKAHLGAGWVATLALVSAIVSALPAQAQTKGGGSVSVGVRGGSGAVRVQGTATYGYGRGRGGWHGGWRGGWHGGWGYGWRGGWGYRSSAFWWGWPYYYAGWYYPRPYYYYGPSVAVGSVPYRAPGVVETAVKPKKASVSVDGQPWGAAKDFNGSWDRLYLAPGNHELEFNQAGYQTLRLHLKIEPGGFYRIDQRLQEGDGLDARSTEALPEPVRTAHSAAPVLPDTAPPRGTVEPQTRPRQTSIPSGLLHISAWPVDAAVYLDGEFLAQAQELNRLHGALPVAVGAHRIEIVRPGYSSEQIVVDVGQDEPERIELRLVRE